MFWFYLTLLSVTTLSILVVTYLTYKSEHFKIGVLVITLLGVLTVAQWFVIERVKSQPMYSTSAEFFVLSYIDLKPHVFIWILAENDTYPRTLQVDWSEELIEQLNANEEGIEEGNVQGRVTFKPGTPFGNLELFVFDINSFLKKEDE
jgi:hypothetical protein